MNFDSFQAQNQGISQYFGWQIFFKNKVFFLKKA